MIYTLTIGNLGFFKAKKANNFSWYAKLSMKDGVSSNL